MTDVLTNGHRPKGRAAPPPTVKFSSGYSVTVRRLPPMTQQRIAESIAQLDEVRGVKRPTPPMVDNGDELPPSPNDADPDYLAAVERFDAACKVEFSDRLLLFVCLDAVEIELTAEQRAIVERTRRRLTKVGAWRDDPDLDADENDRVLFIQHIAATNGDDLRALYRAVVELSEPTPEVVEQHIESFPSNAS